MVVMEAALRWNGTAKVKLLFDFDLIDDWFAFLLGELGCDLREGSGGAVVFENIAILPHQDLAVIRHSSQIDRNSTK